MTIHERKCQKLVLFCDNICWKFEAKPDLLTSPRPSPSPKPKAPKSPKKGKRNLASGLVIKILVKGSGRTEMRLFLRAVTKKEKK